jgi:acyl-CoA reductase-like NAD-dependent aldehyde dehydrogenase
VGPLVNASGLKTIDSQVKDSVKEAAEILTEILTEGEQTGRKGYFYKPTMLKNSHTNTLSFMYQRITSIFTSKEVTPSNV